MANSPLVCVRFLFHFPSARDRLSPAEIFNQRGYLVLCVDQEAACVVLCVWCKNNFIDGITKEE